MIPKLDKAKSVVRSCLSTYSMCAIPPQHGTPSEVQIADPTRSVHAFVSFLFIPSDKEGAGGW